MRRETVLHETCLPVFDEASRLAAWIRDFSDVHEQVFVSDIKAVLTALDFRYAKVWEETEGSE